MRRAARWDGAVPLFLPPTTARLRRSTRSATWSPTSAGSATDQEPFDVVVGGVSPADPAKARELVAPLADAGATWWDERQLQTGPDFDRLAPVLRRINEGPPAL